MIEAAIVIAIVLAVGSMVGEAFVGIFGKRSETIAAYLYIAVIIFAYLGFLFWLYTMGNKYLLALAASPLPLGACYVFVENWINRRKAANK